MNRKIGMTASIVNVIAVGGFALSMLLGNSFTSYLTSIFIAFSFVIMMCTFSFYTKEEAKVAGSSAVGFAVMYAAINSFIYFTQITTVRAGGLSEQASAILDFEQFGLFFNCDMLGYALMSLATFFAGLTIDAASKSDKWLKALLLIHGVFFISCFIMPLLGLFHAGMEGGAQIGTSVLIFWCVYFIPIGVLSFWHFSGCEK
ncbi:hypothetical protein [Konateibacter massiliensis]|uniref:hypothetical protein n=1 Tax=Konateibacter massiliensis TaxID=2002841 RepID=UPI000C156A6C|nr:hypothetical protein [Konateibacter massiliensis]